MGIYNLTRTCQQLHHVLKEMEVKEGMIDAVEDVCASVIDDIISQLPVFDVSGRRPEQGQGPKDPEEIDLLAVQISLTKNKGSKKLVDENDLVQKNKKVEVAEDVQLPSRSSSRMSGRRPIKLPKDLKNSGFVTGDCIDSISSDIEIPSSEGSDVDDEDRPLAMVKKKNKPVEVPELIELTG